MTYRWTCPCGVTKSWCHAYSRSRALERVGCRKCEEWKHARCMGPAFEELGEVET
jgi:hypothetical protein